MTSSDAGEEWAQLVEEHRVDMPDADAVRRAQDLSRHYAEQFASQGEAGDPCIDKVLAYKDSHTAYVDAHHRQWEAVLNRTIARQQLRISTLSRNSCVTPSCFEDADKQIAADQRGVASADAEVHKTAQSLSDAWQARHEAIADLKACRDQHPYEHECGERGGPGVRRPDGKCAAWTDLESDQLPPMTP
ncbi:MAG TPA: hypothetical protein VFE07_06255 [Marmoricola sp.]|nr:hypothetical protein [Marmoricola sp.]